MHILHLSVHPHQCSRGWGQDVSHRGNVFLRISLVSLKALKQNYENRTKCKNAVGEGERRGKESAEGKP